MKKKDNGLKAIICLAAATVAVGVASIAVSSMDKTTSTNTGITDNAGGNGTVADTGSQNNAGGQGSTVDKTGTVLSIEGANAKIKEARKNDDGTYTVVIAEEGFGGEMIVEAVYSADGQTLVSYDVLSHGETPTIGSKVDEDDYKAVLAGVKLPVTVNGLDISAILGVAKEEAPADSGSTEEVELKDGVYKAQTAADDKGNYAFVSITVKGGKITEATWDEMNNGGLKSELSKTGQYVMKPVWATQAASVGKYVVDNQGTAGLLNEKGYTDVVSGVSINVAGFAGLVDKAVAEANGKDGVYEVKADADDKGNYAFVNVTIAGGKITEVVWDEVYNGGLKSELSKKGEYAMKPVWATQAESMCKYVVDNQGTAGLNLTDAGKTDVVSGVSISVNGFTGLVEECLVKAAAAYKDGEYTAQTAADENGNYSFVTVTVEDGKVTEVFWDAVQGGESKRKLAEEGKYVMVPGNPTWKDQSDALGAYVVANQTTEGILNENGKTDVVSGVSITVTDFVELTNKAMAQASASVSLKDGVYTAQTEADKDGNYSFVTIVVGNGKIVSNVWDVMQGGESKRKLAEEGKYVMVPGNPTWKDQSEALGAYVVANQTTEGILNENGKTDAVSGVSITVTDFVELTNQAIAQASETEAVSKPAVEETKAPAVEATKVDTVSGATISSKAVVRAIDEGFVFLRDCVLNK